MDAETDRRLAEIRDEILEIKKLLIGNGDTDGALSRITKIEERQSFLKTCYVWLLIGVGSLLWMVVPQYFQQQEQGPGK